MARNRKRRDPSRSNGEPEQPSLATARAQRESTRRSRVDDPSDPMGQAAPDAELAEAQLAAGEARADEPEGRADSVSEAQPYELEETVDVPLADEALAEDEAEEHERGVARRPVARRGIIGFARGSWRELQRVQWPDQRQVVQATGVVIGFVIVAGAYLGLADFVARKVVHFILS